MAISLAKEQKISLTKEAGGGLTKVFMGLDWDPVKAKGLFGGLFGGGDGGSIDLDASCMMFDSNKQLVDTVWFLQLQSHDGSIRHSGDNLTGDGAGDDEVINVDLTRIPSNVQSLVFVITSFRGQTFDKVDSAFCRLVDVTKNKELARYTLSDKTPVTAQVMAKVYKENGEWMMQAIGAPTNGTVQNQLLPVVQRYL
jgi:tellurium resistance protein TerZ